MKEEKKQEIALMKYGAIAPLIAGLEDEHPSQIAFFRAVSEKGVMGADGRVQHYSPETIKGWYLKYKKDGFDALMPSNR